MKKKYSVTLSNQDCIFASHGGFDTAEKALEWATGRGGSYVAHIDVGKAEEGKTVSVSVDDESFSIWDEWEREWKRYTAAQLAGYLRSNL